MVSKLRRSLCTVEDKDQAPTEGCTAGSHSCMLCVHETQTCWQKGIAADLQFPQHLACTLPVGFRDEGLSQELGKLVGRHKCPWKAELRWVWPCCFGGSDLKNCGSGLCSLGGGSASERDYNLSPRLSGLSAASSYPGHLIKDGHEGP